MYRHYLFATVSDEELDQMLAEAEASEALREALPLFVRLDGEADEQAVDRAVGFVLGEMAAGDEADHGRGLIAADLLDAAERWGSQLGTVMRSPGCHDQVLKLDYDACTDVLAAAVMADLPDWVAFRYRRLLAARAPGEPGAAPSSAPAI